MHDNIQLSLSMLGRYLKHVRKELACVSIFFRMLTYMMGVSYACWVCLMHVECVSRMLGVSHACWVCPMHDGCVSCMMVCLIYIFCRLSLTRESCCSRVTMTM